MARNAPIRVLLADDHDVVRQGFRLVLQTQHDLEVVGEASNGREAIERARRLRPNLVLMDVDMPVMDGLEAARALRDRRPALPVIILSAYEDPALKNEAAAANAYAYLVKGCSGGLVLDTIEQAFQARAGR